MTTDVVALKCNNCGGKLDVYPDMDRFACSYCGAEAVVIRRGGTISLARVEDAVRQVQLGTDKALAELALQRFTSEKEILKARYAKEMRNHSASWSIVCIAIFIALGGSAAIYWGYMIGVLLFPVSVILFVIGVRSLRQDTRAIASIRADGAVLEQRILDNRRIVDGEA